MRAFSFAIWAATCLTMCAATHADQREAIAQVTLAHADGRTIEVRALYRAPDDRLVTRSGERGQVLFLDGSALTVGPDSEVAVEAFEYDPSSGRGRIALSGQGDAFRLVGGRISKHEAVTFRAPTMTVALRGGVALFGATDAALVYGDGMRVRDMDGGELELKRAGTGVALAADGRLGSAAPIDRGELVGRLAALEGSSAAAAAPPVNRGAIEQRVAGTAIAALGSAIAPPRQPQAPDVRPRLEAPLLPPVPAVALAQVTREAQSVNRPDGATVTLPASTPGAAPVTLTVRNTASAGERSVAVARIPNSSFVDSAAGNVSIGNFGGVVFTGSVVDSGSIGSIRNPGGGVGNFGVFTTTQAPSTSQTLNGFFTGFLDAQSGAATTTRLFRGQATDDFEIATDAATRTLTARMRGTSDNGDAYVLRFGGDAQHSTFVNDRNFAAIESSVASTKQGVDASQVKLGIVTTEAVVSAGGGLFAPSCACEFVRWGAFATTMDPAQGGRDTITVGRWVAGRIPDAATVAGLSATASYAGLAVGEVLSNGGRYSATGNFSATYDFAARKSTAFRIDRFDGYTLNGSMTSLAGSGNRYAGPLSGSGGPGGALSGSADGAFFSSPTNPVAGTGGQFAVQNSGGTYKATGIFVGQ